MKYREAIEQGYKFADTALARGYVSANADVMDAVVKQNRKGMYVDIHNPNSTRYVIRVYLTKEGK